MASGTSQMHLLEVGESPLANILEKRKSAPENNISAMIEPSIKRQKIEEPRVGFETQNNSNTIFQKT